MPRAPAVGHRQGGPVLLCDLRHRDRFNVVHDQDRSKRRLDGLSAILLRRDLLVRRAPARRFAEQALFLCFLAMLAVLRVRQSVRSRPP